VPRITLRIGPADGTGNDETLTEYICDWTDCPNLATEVLGVVRELGIATVVCEHHAAMIRTRAAQRRQR
jgi:hypothetical protein